MPRDKFATPVELSKVGRNHGQKKWLDSDSAGNGFKDKRLQQRFRKLLEQIWNSLVGVSHFRKISCNILILTHLKGIKIA